MAKNWAIGLDKVALDAFEFIGNAEVKLRTQTVKARLRAHFTNIDTLAVETGRPIHYDGGAPHVNKGCGLWHH